MSRKRKAMSRRKSRSLFRKTASRTHAYNLHKHGMRGGFRL